VLPYQKLRLLKHDVETHYASARPVRPLLPTSDNACLRQLSSEIPVKSATVTIPKEVDMRDTKERLSVLWIFALLNYLYADVVALFAIAGSGNSFEHLSPWALMGSAVLMEIPIAMILASRLLPFRANRLANIIAGVIVTLVNGFLTFVPPLAGWGRPPAFPEYLFFATIETVATSVIIWQAWTWSGVEAEVSTERSVRQPEVGIISS
jgi:Family of unknown function (DUF6326)